MGPPEHHANHSELNERAAGGQDVWRAVLSHPYSVAAMILLLVMGIGAVARKDTADGPAWNRVYVGSARMLLHGGDFYRQISGYAYPPFSALINIPFAPMPPKVARGLWYVISAASLIYLIVKSWQIAGGPPVEPGGRHPGAGPAEQVAFLLGNALALQFALNALTHLQTDLLIAALLIAGCAAIRTGRFMSAATWIGVAAAFKATPLLFGPYLLLKRRWLAAAWLVCVAVGANFLPDLVNHPPGGGIWLTQFYGKYLKPLSKPDYRPGDWANQLNNNQALAGTVRRWLATTWQSSRDDFRVFDRPGRASPRTIRLTFYTCCAAVLLPVLWVGWRRRRTESRSGGDPPQSPPTDREILPDAAMIECGIVMILMLLLSPNSSRAHLCILYLPAFCVARVAVHLPSPLVRIPFALAVLCSVLSIRIRVRASMLSEQTLLWLGILTFSALFLLLASTVALLRVPQRDGPVG